MWVNLRLNGWSLKSVFKKTEIHQAGQVSVRKHHTGGQEGQKTVLCLWNDPFFCQSSCWLQSHVKVKNDRRSLQTLSTNGLSSSQSWCGQRSGFRILLVHNRVAVSS